MGTQQQQPFQFKKVLKHRTNGRIALVGPAGSGKSFTMLTLARELAGPTGRIAAVDTEHGSLSLYAHQEDCPPNCTNPNHFDFDGIEMTSYSPENFEAALRQAEQDRYDVFCCDSLSHFWMGKDGALEFVDQKSKRDQGKADSFSGWKAFRPHERKMVDMMTASPMHVIVTMRTKTEYMDVDKPGGGKKRVKVGLQPVQRDGLEYEFDLVGYLDDENHFIVDKTRCPLFSGRVIEKPSAADFRPFKEWLYAGTQRVGQPVLVQPLAAGKISDATIAALSPAPALVFRLLIARYNVICDRWPERAAEFEKTYFSKPGGKTVSWKFLLSMEPGTKLEQFVWQIHERLERDFGFAVDTNNILDGPGSLPLDLVEDDIPF